MVSCYLWNDIKAITVSLKLMKNLGVTIYLTLEYHSNMANGGTWMALTNFSLFLLSTNERMNWQRMMKTVDTKMIDDIVRCLPQSIGTGCCKCRPGRISYCSYIKTIPFRLIFKVWEEVIFLTKNFNKEVCMIQQIVW